MKNDPIQSALARLDEVPLRTAEGQKQMAKALAANSNLVAAKAARIAGDARWAELIGDLAAGFDRLRERGAEVDPGCAAKKAMARALVNMDYDGAELYLNGMRQVQMEPVWEGSMDTAAEGSEAALLLLRFKALSGDREAEVLGDCFSELLAGEGAEVVPFIASFANSRDEETREAAVLALGASRRSEAIEWMKQRFGEIGDRETQKCILLSLATARTDAAIEFVIGLIREGSPVISQFALSAMEINRGDGSIQERVEQAMRERTQAKTPAPPANE